MPVTPRLLAAGDQALIVEYGDAIDEGVNRRVRALAAALEASRTPGLVETVPTYRSLMIHYDPLVLPAADLERLVHAADEGLDAASAPGARLVEIPTAYGDGFGPDLAEVAAHAKLTEDEVVAIHTATDYLVYMMGFMPGFPYLGGMSARIAAPRLGTPRTAVPAGSVGIAGSQTGIYPSVSPGGWRLIGRTPVPLFDASATPPALCRAGDRLRFVRVTTDEYAAVVERIRRGTFEPAVRPWGPA